MRDFYERLKILEPPNYGLYKLLIIFKMLRNVIMVRHAVISWNLIMEELKKWQDLEKVLEPQL